MKPRSDACERNRDPILKVLQQWFLAPGTVLEIGSGTGQHAVHFAAHLPHLTWIATDRAENLQGIQLWFDDAVLPNLRGPLQLDVNDEPWPVTGVAYAFSANTTHIMSWPEVELMFAGIGRVLLPKGIFCLYGPINSDGAYTSESNRQFDQRLRGRDSAMGLRDDQELIELGRRNQLSFAGDYSLPANNRVLVWQR